MRRYLRTLIFLTLGLLVAVGFGTTALASPNAQTATPELAQLTGVVTVNNELAPSGVQISASLEDNTLCGSTATNENGQYQLDLFAECVVGESLVFRLKEVDREAALKGLVPEGTEGINISFEGLSQANLIALGLIVAATESKDRPLLEGEDLRWLLIVVILGEVALLAMMIVASSISTKDTDIFRRQVEGAVLLGVVVAIMVLGITGKIGDEGLVSVLAAIVGYTLGRASQAVPTPPQPQPQPQPATVPPTQLAPQTAAVPPTTAAPSNQPADPDEDPPDGWEESPKMPPDRS